MKMKEIGPKIERERPLDSPMDIFIFDSLNSFNRDKVEYDNNTLFLLNPL